MQESQIGGEMPRNCVLGTMQKQLRRNGCIAYLGNMMMFPMHTRGSLVDRRGFVV